MRVLLLFILFFGIFFISISQPGSKRISREEYIETYKSDAIKEMHRSGVPASITLAQGILESGDGNSPLARYANNHFGIKCHSNWKGKTFIQDDDEKDECFRSYRTALESFHDHSDFLQRKRYADLFELKVTDYKGWAKGLKKAGYATNPKYPQLLIEIIEKNDLAKYDQTKAGKVRDKKPKKEKKERAIAQSDSKRKGIHRTFVHENNIKYIKLKLGDSFEKIADEFNMGEWQLIKYNDWSESRQIEEGAILFLQPKRRKAKEDYHFVGSGETMWDISQLHGIKLKKLYRRNRMDIGTQAEVGQKLFLRKTKPRN